jgi:sulfite reductase (NADPH) hemoprotein beta-component
VAEDGGARFGKLAAKIPRRRVPEAVERLTRLWLAERRPGEEAGAFFAREFELARAAVEQLEALHLEDASEDDFARIEEDGEAARPPAAAPSNAA